MRTFRRRVCRESRRSLLVALNIMAVIVLFSGCQKEPPWKSRAYIERTSSGGVGSVLIPESLWNRVIEPARPLKDLMGNPNEKDPKKAEKESAVANVSIETDLKPLAVYLIEQTHGVLGGRNHKVLFGPGGGDLDLRDFVVENRGAMRVVFQFAESVDPNAKRRVWYLSNAKRRRVGNDEVGAGCRVYMDISSVVETSLRGEGLLFAIGDDRHVSAMSGTYFFSVNNGSRVEVSRVTIYDSSKRALLCLSNEPVTGE